jgi:hypothetical protein
MVPSTLSVSLNLLVAQAGCILELSSKSNLLSALTPASGMGWGLGAAAPGSVGLGSGPLAWGGQTAFPPGVGPAGRGGWPQTGVGVGAGALPWGGVKGSQPFGMGQMGSVAWPPTAGSLTSRPEAGVPSGSQAWQGINLQGLCGAGVGRVYLVPVGVAGWLMEVY